MLVMLVVLLSSGCAQAVSSNTVVRVGVYDMGAFCSCDELGHWIGYNIDYLTEVAHRTGWTYEFVDIHNFATGMNMLKQQKIDLLAPCQMTDRRRDEFLFSAYPFGTEYVALVTDANKSAYAFQDYEAFQNMRVAAAKNYLITEHFKEFEKENGFSVNLCDYEDVSAADRAVHAGEADAAIVNLMMVDSRDKMLARFNPQPFYYMTWQGNDRLIAELNGAMNNIQINFPQIQSDLVDKYFPSYKQQYFSVEELKDVQSLGELTLGYVDDRCPISFTDADGSFAGMTRDVLDKITQLSGVKFRYVALPTDRIIDYNYLREHHIDIVCGVEYNSANLNSQGLTLSNPYLSMNKVFVGRNHVKFDKNAQLTLAMHTGSQTIKSVIQAKYPNFTIVDCFSEKACFDAVTAGDADVLLLNQYVVDVWLSKPKYEKLDVIPIEGLEDNLCMSLIVFQNGAGVQTDKFDPNALVRILNKGISQITKDETDAIIVGEAMQNKYRYTKWDILYKYRLQLIPSILLVLVILLSLAHGMHVRKRTLRLVQTEEAKLKSIANNINGGVMIVIPDIGFRITYANEGLLMLLGYEPQDTDKLVGTPYISYVHTDDIPKLNALIADGAAMDKRMSILLKIQKKDGTYLDTLFSGTLTKSVTGQTELYCVLMDMSEQTEMRDRLDIQRKRNDLILEKSDDVIFGVDAHTREVTVSDKMMQKFGWTFPDALETFNLYHLLKYWDIAPQDRTYLRDSFLKLISQKLESRCLIRVNKAGGGCLWCSISSYAILDKKHDLTGIVGKIVDVDVQVKEKRTLEIQSQSDGMTGLLNKTAFIEQTQEYLSKHSARGTALVFMDLDHFKSINDTLGHIVGDHAIRDAADKIKTLFDGRNLVARFGGDEFCIFVEDIPLEQLEEKSEKTVTCMRASYTDGRHTVRISSSIGIVYCEKKEMRLHEMLDGADQALYESKNKGRNRFTLYRT